MRLRNFRHLFVLVCALSCRADTWPEGDEQLDTDLDLLLDVLRRTRGTSVPPPKKKIDYAHGGSEVNFPDSIVLTLVITDIAIYVTNSSWVETTTTYYLSFRNYVATVVKMNLQDSTPPSRRAKPPPNPKPHQPRNIERIPLTLTACARGRSIRKRRRTGSARPSRRESRRSS